MKPQTQTALSALLALAPDIPKIRVDAMLAYLRHDVHRTDDPALYIPFDEMVKLLHVSLGSIQIWAQQGLFERAYVTGRTAAVGITRASYLKFFETHLVKGSDSGERPRISAAARRLIEMLPQIDPSVTPQAARRARSILEGSPASDADLPRVVSRKEAAERLDVAPASIANYIATGALVSIQGCGDASIGVLESSIRRCILRSVVLPKTPQEDPGR